ncbi:MAG TPA: phosphotransferase family protein [Rhizorhapis sp.]
MAETSYSDDERKLVAFVEQVTGGRVTAMRRQPRWRPAWFVDVERDGLLLPIHIRGDRKSDIMPFPELAREAAIMEVLEEHGIPVPHIYGVCPDPEAIIMAAIPGSRDVSTAGDDAERQSVARQYVEAMAAMHRLPLEPFVARGLTLPEGADEIALAGLHAYYPMYARRKTGPQPLVEFAIGWLKRNVPKHRTRPSFAHFDAGQFLFVDGRITGLYDFEFSMIGDPFADLATMRMRDSYEPTGDSIANLIRHYEAVTGEAVDRKVVSYHTALFSAISAMQIGMAVADPQPGDPHSVYIEWTLALRLTLAQALAECTGAEVGLPELPEPTGVPANGLMKMLEDSIAAIPTQKEAQANQKHLASRLAEYAARHAVMAEPLERLSRLDAADMLDPGLGDADDFDVALERFVLAAGPNRESALIGYFLRQTTREMLAYRDTDVGQSASHVQIAPLD